MTTIFVYGTLKTGKHNHYYLKQDANKFLSNYTVPGYKLIQIEGHAYSVPFMIPSNENDIVVGELWEVTDATYQNIKILESGYSEVEIEKGIIAYIIDKNASIYYYIDRMGAEPVHNINGFYEF